jgi:hypothetical protein
MFSPVKTAGYAALIFFFALLTHCINAFYVEPTYLGFESPMVDYANMNKILAATNSWPWWFSGLAHLASGFVFPIIGLGAYALFKDDRPLAAQMALVASLFAGVGYLMTGISDVKGAGLKLLLMQFNPENDTPFLMATSYMRNLAVVLGVSMTGWFAAQLSWCVLRTDRLSKIFGYYGFLAGLAGLAMFFTFTLYLPIHALWALWLGILLLRASI